MLQKWKCILTNWINCYCNETDSKDLDITLDSLLIIISQLRRNLSLDESTSSLLEAQNIHDFILEKYPDFKFDNGTCDPRSEGDLYLSASLLLFFVCVNSKNIDLKKAMCSKLSSSDQETIMKFSKCLMGCRNITSLDVLQAITEACGQDIAGVETVGTNTVAETPPAIRSLHSEVRRLQAALDAERFDRNYLQEELSRTNLKLEKLSKIKEQYKIEIVNLKSKVSDSCEDNNTAGNETSHNNSVKLAKQLEQAEERLASLQEELSNAEYERNSYKSKLDELKRDRDKYLALSQQENIRASQLAEELDSERRQCNSLRELVTELRQHNRLNRMDSSQLECDELDTSVHSLQHNSSVCSEVCASIIEVQLAEERTKITTLKNQMQMLQDQLTELNNKYEQEKMDLSKTLSEKECDIMNLKHRINEEIESRNIMKSHYDNDITKLNNELNELEQTLKDTTENARKTIDTKMQEIQTLQEEKLSLLQSFSNETSKLEAKVHELKKEVDAEKASKQKIREDYDTHIMKLNEKVLNRNNELVELQNKIVVKGEEIESLQLQLRNEKDMRQELINKHNNDVLHYNNVIKEQNLNAQKSSEEIGELRKQVQQYYQYIEEMNKERNELNTSLLCLKEEVKNLTSEKQVWLNEKEKFQHEFDEKNETINSLKSQLQTEIQFKNKIQNELHELESDKEKLSEEKASLTNKVSAVIAENSETCEKLNLCIVQEKQACQSLQIQVDNSEKKIKKLSEIIEQKEDKIKHLEENLTGLEQNNQKLISDFESERLILKNMVSVTESVMEDQKLSFTKEIKEYSKAKDILEEQVKKLEEVIEREKVIMEDQKLYFTNEIEKYSRAKDVLQEQVKKLEEEIKSEKEILKDQKVAFTNEIEEYSKAKDILQEQVKKLEDVIEREKQIIEEQKTTFTNEIEEYSKAKYILQEQVYNLEKDIKSERQIVEDQKLTLTNEIKESSRLKDDLQEQVKKLEAVIKIEKQSLKTVNMELNEIKKEKEDLRINVIHLQEDVVEKSAVINSLNEQKADLTEALHEKDETIHKLKDKMKGLIEDKIKLTAFKQEFLHDFEKLKMDKNLMNENLVKFENINNTLENKLATLEERVITETKKAALVLQTKVNEIETLEKELSNVNEEKLKIEEKHAKLQEDLMQKTFNMEKLTSENAELTATLEHNNQALNKLQDEMKELVENKNKIANDLNTEKQELINKIDMLEKDSKQCKETMIKNIQDLQEVIIIEKQKSDIEVAKKVEEIEVTLKELKQIKEEKLDIEENMSRVREDVIQMTSFIEALKAENNELVATLTRTKDDVAKLKSEMKNKLEAKIRETSDYEGEKQDLINKIEMLEQDKACLENNVSENRQTNESLQKQIQYMEAILKAEKQETVMALDKKVKKLEETLTELNNLKEEKANIEENMTRLQQDVIQTTSYIETLKSENNELASELNLNKKALSLLEEEMKSITDKNYNLIHELESEKRELELILSETQSIMEKQRQDLNDKIVKETQSKGTLHEQITFLQDQIVQEREIAEAKLNEKEDCYISAVQELNALKEEKVVLAEKVSILENELSEKVLVLDNISKEKCDVEKSLEDNQNTIKILHQELEIARLKQEEAKTALESVKNEFSKEKEILMEKESKYIKANENLQEEVKRLQNIFDKEKVEAEIQINSLKAEHKIKLDEINSLKAEKDALIQNVEQLHKHISEKTSEVERLNIEKNDTIEYLERKCSDIEMKQLATNDSVSCGLQNLIDNLVKEGINGDIIQKLEMVQNTDDLSHSFDSIVEAVTVLAKELSIRKSLEKALEVENTAVEKLTSLVKQKEVTANELQEELNNLQKLRQNSKLEFTKQVEEYKRIVEEKTKEVESLVLQNTTLHNEVNDVKIQLDTKVHSLKDKLIDNENITDKLKATYESQIDNLNVMVSKLTSYLKEKTIEMEAINKDKSQIEESLNESNKAISLLEEELKCQKQKHEKLINEFESERVVLKNMVSVSETVMEDQKSSLNNKITELSKQNEELKENIKKIEEEIATERKNAEILLKEKIEILNIALKDLSEIKNEKKILEEEILTLKGLFSKKTEEVETIVNERNNLEKVVESVNNEKYLLENKLQEFGAEKESQITVNTNLLKEKEHEIVNLRYELKRQAEATKQFEDMQKIITKERDEIVQQLHEKETLLETEKNLRLSQLEEIQKLQQLQTENLSLQNIIKEKESEIITIKEHLKNEDSKNQQVSDKNRIEQINLANKCEILEEYQMKAEEELKYRQMKIEVLVSEMESIKNEFARVELEKNILIEKLESELKDTKNNYLHYKQEAEKYNTENAELKKHLNAVNTNTLYNLKKENELLLKAVTNNENMAVNDKENIPNYREDVAMKKRELQNQVYDSAFDNTTSSVDSTKTISDLEKIIQDKNRTITTLNSDITYLKTLIAESENKLLDVTKDLDLSRENCHQLSNQLKKVVLQKNEEIAELKNKITKMSATETSASQIIKVSTKYQAMIKKRIAEIKNNTVLKEVTNFGNSTTNYGDNELRRSFNAGNITMEDLENFLETTDRHLKRCSEKQIAMQKERDRLLEINKINDSEIIAMRKFLTELSVSVKTFNSVKELYSQKLNRVISLQRTVRREILNLDGRINDATMCKLERGYAAIMQDLSECALNLERWVDRSIVRSISPEKIKQAFMSELDRASLVPTNFQNTSLEIQFRELETSFQKLLKEVMLAQSGEGVKDTQALTLMEVRAEYEDKLTRMKAKMKDLYVDQISQFQEKQKKEIEEYERKLEKANEKLQEMSEAYQHHIRGLTTELWNVGEKFVIQKDEAQWLRKQQKSGSLMSLQHVHSTGLVGPHEDAGRPSDTHSLRSLQVHSKNIKKGRKTCGDMSDEEGEVFDNRCLRELTETPRRARPSLGGGARAGGGAGAGARLSELQRRNTLCRPHLKSSYPAETQFVPGVQEEDIKCNGSMSLGGKAQRKEVGITAYKKPGPPTPSKQAGRLSATDSELRESLRVETEPGARRTATPSRLFGLFRGKQDTIEGTPRGRRLSNIFRKK